MIARINKRRGFTLIEILIVSMIIVVVAGIILVLYQTVVGVQRTQQQMAQGSAALGQAMRIMTRDLACSHISEQPGTEFILTTAVKTDRRSSSVAFCATLADQSASELSWNQTVSITYFVDELHYPEPTLLRVSRNLVGVDHRTDSITNELVRNVEFFEMKVFNGKEWVSEWSSEDEEALPQAAQLAIEMIDGASTTTQRVTKVFMPAGAGSKDAK